MTTWIAGYQSGCEDARIYYDSIGSGGGRNQFIDDAGAFAGTDAAMDPDETEDALERCGGSPTSNLPAYTTASAGGITPDGADWEKPRPDTSATRHQARTTR